MKKLIVLFSGVFLLGCGSDATVSSQQVVSKTMTDISYNESQVKLSSETDSISYILGLEMSKPFLQDSVFSNLNRDLVSQGFAEGTEAYSFDSCQQVVQSYVSSQDLRKDKAFAEQCAISMGRIQKSGIVKTFSDMGAMDILNLSVVTNGFKDGLSLKNVFKDDSSSVNILFAELRTKMDAKYKASIESTEKEGLNFLKQNKSKKGVKTTLSGLQYKVIRKGKGMNPSASSRVRVNYKGSLLSGEVFDSSYERGTPTEFGLNQVIPGWTEGIQLMKPGSKFVFYIPQELAYGSNPDPRSGIKPYSLLIFEVELLEILNP
ncbi:MAG: FKBP-type peptidyl-prolyl cis-trans isomerase [Crocinitomicaceae bacterium]|nr:FKBP-type peptidyl-prolyl cis-trans isomerase [Crocinitomicaceae bacterium]MDG1734766.1 FKBP-type peptidyl-prolyl cis-trans isomerase [Crocinitomicaceae bacterium]